MAQEPDSNNDEVDGDRGVIPMMLVPSSYRTTLSKLVDGTWYIIAIAAVILNIIAMALNESAISIVVGIATLVVAPVIIYNQTKLDNLDCKSFRLLLFFLALTGSHSSLIIFSHCARTPFCFTFFLNIITP